jgi:FkbM family methyltransferase
LYKFLKLGSVLFDNVYPVYLVLYVLYKRVTDYQERSLIKKNIQSGDIVIDIGANIGIYTKFLARCVGSKGKVYAFEPSPRNFHHLESYVRKLTNVSIKNQAIGAESGTVNLYLSRHLNVDHHTYPTSDKREIVAISCTRLDDHFPPLQRIDLVKIDTQGYEYQVLLGMQGLINSNKNIKIILEFWPYGLRAAGSDPRLVIDFLKEHDFDLNVIKKSGLFPYAESEVINGDNYINMFACRQKLL